MSSRDRAIRRARARARDARTRIVTGRGSQHFDCETGERVPATGAYLAAGGSLTINFGGGGKRRADG